MPRVRKDRQVGYRPKRETALKAARLELKRLMDILCAAAEKVEKDDSTHDALHGPRDRVASPPPRARSPSPSPDSVIAPASSADLPAGVRPPTPPLEPSDCFDPKATEPYTPMP